MNQTILALDYGTKKIGIAIGETITANARPLSTLKNKQGQPDWQNIQQLIQEWQPDILIVGLPLREDGAETKSSELARIFIKQLQKRFEQPVHAVNEYLSSHDAAQRIQGWQGNKNKKSRHSLDAVAAQIILETWLAE